MMVLVQALTSVFKSGKVHESMGIVVPQEWLGFRGLGVTVLHVG